MGRFMGHGSFCFKRNDPCLSTTELGFKGDWVGWVGGLYPFRIGVKYAFVSLCVLTLFI